MSKRRKRQVIAPPLTRKQISKRQKEERLRRWVIIGTTIVLLLIAGVLGYGLYQQYVVAPAKPVATVNDVPIRVDAYQRLVQYRRFDLHSLIARMDAQIRRMDPTDPQQQFLISYLQQQIDQAKGRLMSLPTSVLDEMIEDELIRQECATNNIVVTDEEVQLEIERQFGYDRNPPTPTPTPITMTVPVTMTPEPTATPMTEEQFKTLYSEYIQKVKKQTGITERELRELIRVSLLRQKLQDFMAERVPTTAEQVHCRHILVKTEEEANEVLERLRKGDDFAELAKEYSTDESNRDKGGDLGWFARGKMVKEFEDAAFALQPGEISDVVQTTFGYHIIQCLERDENRELDEETLKQRKQSALTDWLLEQKSSDAVKRYWSSDLVPPDEWEPQ